MALYYETTIKTHKGQWGGYNFYTRGVSDYGWGYELNSWGFSCIWQSIKPCLHNNQCVVKMIVPIKDEA